MGYGSQALKLLYNYYHGDMTCSEDTPTDTPSTDEQQVCPLAAILIQNTRFLFTLKYAFSLVYKANNAGLAINTIIIII